MLLFSSRQNSRPCNCTQYFKKATKHGWFQLTKHVQYPTWPFMKKTDTLRSLWAFRADTLWMCNILMPGPQKNIVGHMTEKLSDFPLNQRNQSIFDLRPLRNVETTCWKWRYVFEIWMHPRWMRLFWFFMKIALTTKNASFCPSILPCIHANVLQSTPSDIMLPFFMVYWCTVWRGDSQSFISSSSFLPPSLSTVLCLIFFLGRQF